MKIINIFKRIIWQERQPDIGMTAPSGASVQDDFAPASPPDSTPPGATAPGLPTGGTPTGATAPGITPGGTPTGATAPNLPPGGTPTGATAPGITPGGTPTGATAPNLPAGGTPTDATVPGLRPDETSPGATAPAFPPDGTPLGATAPNLPTDGTPPSATAPGLPTDGTPTGATAPGLPTDGTPTGATAPNLPADATVSGAEGGAPSLTAAPADPPGNQPAAPARCLPLYSKIFFAIAGFSLLIFVAAIISPPFADTFNRYPGSFVRGLLSHLTSWIPFSLAEAALLLLPFILFFLMRIAVRKYSDSWRNTWVYVGILLSCASIFFSVFVLGFGTGYRGSTLDEKLEFDIKDITAEELYETARFLADRINAEAANITFKYKGFSVMPYNLGEMNDKLNAAFERLADEYDLIPRLYSRVKPVMLSEPMSYTHITGVYTYFTGESNINVAFPDYSLPFTAAHELAHQRGIAREEEANFIAYRACTLSDDPYIRYSGYLSLYEYVAPALYKADQTLYSKVQSTLSGEVKGEIAAFRVFFKKYERSVASKVSGAINDTHLKIQGTQGTISYRLVVELAVGYYRAGGMDIFNLPITP